MAKRIKVGLIYSYNKDWVAGAYYILNLIQALKELHEEDKPELSILCYSADEFETVKQTGYPYLKFVQLREDDFKISYSLAERIVNKASRTLLKKNIFYRTQTNKRLEEKLDVLFPANNHIYFSSVKNRLFWIPDFQEHFLPQFFSEKELKDRKNYQAELAAASKPIVFSSADALSHFKKIYPASASKTFVLQFAVTHPAYKNISIDALLKKYDVNKKYFFCANQFWAHKNHMVVLKAMKELKDKGISDFMFAFSGKETDYRNPDFFKGLKDFVKENKLEEQVRFLGFIDREDQLQLMNNSVCVVQPSFFEGWSTVVEDAKAMGQHVIASNLPVHKEQLLENNADFFNAENEHELAELVDRYLQNPPARENRDYERDVKKFGKQFIGIVKQVIDL